MKLSILAKKTSQENKTTLLDETEFVLANSFTLGKGDRSGDQQMEEFELEAADVLGIELAEGAIWYAASEDIVELFDLNLNRSNTGDEPIHLPNFIRNESERGLGQFLINAFHHFKRKKKALSGNTAKKIAEKIEANIEEGLKRVNSVFELEAYDAVDKKQAIDLGQPILLFIHGTSSSTEGSFGAMKGTDVWTDIYGQYQQNILAFEHRTWSKSPLENALNILEQLPKGGRLHLVTHSRGGLVGDVLCRAVGAAFKPSELEVLENLSRKEDVALLKQLNRVAAKKQLIAERFVRVACPANGTTFLSRRLDHFLNILLNLMPKTGNPFADYSVKALKSLIIQTVGERNNPKVLPGLEAMVPDSPILALLNRREEDTEIPTYVWVIAGHAGGGGVFKTLACILARLYYLMDNDFVVDTDSMFMGVTSRHTRYYKFVKGTDVDHFSYFRNKDTRETLLSILKNEDVAQPIPPSFKPINPEGNNRGVLGIPGGIQPPTLLSKLATTKPILIVVPGIMGSNLGEMEKGEVWLDYSTLLSGGIDKLKIENAEIEAIGIVDSAYGQFVKYIEQENKWEVLVFPYDWRKPIKEAGAKLGARISDLFRRKQDQRIALLGHSMGGLVIRELIFSYKSLWGQLLAQTDFRCILLGTPWKGSFLIPEFITGQGNRIKSLNRLIFYRKKQHLLRIFCKYPGLFELLPLEMTGTIPPFDQKALWTLLKKISKDKKWTIPTQAILDDFATYRAALLEKIDVPFNGQERVYYIAGKSGRTLDHLVFKHALNTLSIDQYETVEQVVVQGKDRPYYKFIPTKKGDGSVTWASGIPKQLSAENVYYVDTTHGELVNDPRHFKAIFEILDRGRTIGLSQAPLTINPQEDLSRSYSEVLSNDPAELMRGVVGLKNSKWYQKDKATVYLPPLKVQMIKGDLRYNQRPVMIGHFEGDGIVSAEKEMDRLLGRQLQKKRNLGIYPGPIGSHLLYEKKEKGSVIIVGLGKPEKLTPFELSNTIEQACLEYISSNEGTRTEEEGYKLTSLLIGSGYANLSISNSIYAILEGVINANKKIKTQYEDSVIIKEIAFIELYEEKAIAAFSILDNLKKSNSLNIEFDYQLQTKNGYRTQMPIDTQRTWWNRFTVKAIKEDGQEKISIGASTGSAGVGQQSLPYDKTLIAKILNNEHTNNIWNKELNQTAFELMIPNNLKISLKNQPNIIWVLDKEMAQYPWEMFQHDEKNGVPYCTKTGMIRQLSTNYLSRNIHSVSDRLALVIGDPDLGDGSMYQLPAAKEEAVHVKGQLVEYGYQTTCLVNEAPIPILTQLRKDYKVIHIASHGVLHHDGVKGKTGILLGDDIVITPHMIHQRPSTPELVFINCCHLGHISPADETETRNKNKFAANIGTELIENGVKAVVMAGWAVNDTAALKFAEVFYENMLKGVPFGKAVKRARSVCYQEFPYTNTWGAYQCYGDPFYQLEKQNTKSFLAQPYILEKEILIDLETLIIKSDSGSGTPKKVLRERLNNISHRIIKSGILITPAILEKEATAYASLNLLKIAIEKYEQLFQEEMAHFEVKSVEQYCNLKMKYLLENDAENLTAANKVIDKLIGLQGFGATSERYSLLGSAYKRKTLMVEQTISRGVANLPKETPKEVLEKMVTAYKDAALLKHRTEAKKDTPLTLETALTINVYWLENWLVGEGLFLNYLSAKKKKEKLVDINAIFPTASILDFLTERLERYAKKDNETKDFWGLVEPVNIRQCYLLFCEATEYESVLEKIKAEYDIAWDKGGTASNLATEITQIRFMLDHLKQNAANKALIRTIAAMKAHFESKVKS